MPSTSKPGFDSMTRHETPRTPRFCPNCGAHNLTTAANCGVCGQPLTKHEDLARLWGTADENRPNDEPEVIDLYPKFDVSSQATTPFTQTRPFDPADVRPKSPPTAGRVRAADPWSSSASKLSRSVPLQSTSAGLAIPIASPAHGIHVKRNGPPGFLLGCFAVLLIAVLAAIVVWGAIRESLSDRVSDEISVGISNELRMIDKAPVPTSGQILLTEEEINADLDRAADWYSPIEDVQVTLEDGAIRVRFKVYGITSTYRSGLAVTGGQVVVVDSSLSGAAGRVVDIDEISAIFESELQELLRRSGLQPVSVTINEGSLILKTKRLDSAAT